MVYFPYLNHEWTGRFFCLWCRPFQTCGDYSMVSLYYYMGKLLIQLTLFVVFLLFFGLPSYRRYHEKVYDGFSTFPLCFHCRKETLSCRQKAFSDGKESWKARTFYFGNFLIFLDLEVLDNFFWYFLTRGPCQLFWYLLTRGSLSRLKREVCRDLNYLQWPSVQGFLLNDKQK